MLCYCVLSSRYDAPVLKFETARDIFIILMISYDILRHCTVLDAISLLKCFLALFNSKKCSEFQE